MSRLRKIGPYRPQCPDNPRNYKLNKSNEAKVNFVFEAEIVPANSVSDPNGRLCEKPAKVVLDTGCSSEIVNEKLVPSRFKLGQAAKVYDFLGVPSIFPRVRCLIQSKFFTGWVNAIAAPIKFADVLIGLIPGVKLPSDKPHPQHNIADKVTEDIVNLVKAEKKKLRLSDLKVDYANFSNSEVALNVQTRSLKISNTKTNALSCPDFFKLSINKNDFSREQQSFTTLRSIRDKIMNGDVIKNKGRSVSYQVIDNLVYKVCIASQNDYEVGAKQLVVPAKYRIDVMRLAHDALAAGHFSHRKTSSKIFDYFFWPGAGADIKRFCRPCPKCQKFSARGSGHKYILTLIDYATRYPEAVPLKNVDTITVAEALVEIFSRVGIPKEIMSDRGSQFKSDLMSEIHRLFSVKALYTSPYHACCNGAVERLNGVLKSIIKKLCSEHPQDLDHYIPAALFAYREIPNSSLKFSPFELLYGRKVRGPLSILHDLWTNDGIDNEVKTTYQYVLDLRSRLEETAKLAASHANISSKSYKAYYDLKSRPRKLEIGDEVLVLLPTSTNKLVMHWRGPYPIIRCHENGVDYIIKMQGKDKLFHINMLKRYFRREDNKEKQKCKNVIQICVEEFPVNGTCEPVNLEVTDNNRFNISSELSLSQSREMSVLLNRYTDVIRDKPGLTQTIRHKIKLTSTVPINKKQYPIPLNLKQEFNKEVDKMLELGHIEPSESPYCSPVVLVKKTDGTWRICIDFRPINSLSDFDAEPMPTTEVALSNFSHDVYFSELDLCKGYWQVPLSSDCKIYTAFATHRGLMQWKVMPFGLKTACATFIRIKYLGVLLGHNCIAPLEEKVKAINSLPLPTTKKQLRSFLGTTGYYRKFIQNYASTAAPLSDLLRKNSSNKLNWNQQQIESFKSLKQALMSNPMPATPGVGAVLLQETNNCKMPIAYASRKLLDREVNYATI
ncbi:uncharacterized protein LOC119584727 [Penaeus monodon]|uniref:uncharacterized protein LOC119584727 n=1 Tax=Penaeus monodon TaxID=6687 RepID=UPI0018A71B97|nr:uncharacterized protein LOC119584727 [Penaeus monodon]